ncbi:MAG: sodium:calcium antiporter [Planctomycetota bacterium]
MFGADTPSSLLALALLGALALLVGGAKAFTAAAERVGLALGQSPFAVGGLIFAGGTSLPELVASTLAAAAGETTVVSGNGLGANTALLLLVLGVAAAVARGGIQLGERYIGIDLNFMAGSAALLCLALADAHVGRLEGVVLLVTYAVYLGYQLVDGRTASADAALAASLPAVPPRVRPRDLAVLLLAGVAIFVGASATLDALLVVAARIGISPATASATILALGTTLPETVVSIAAARAGRPEIAVGNILGSCIFNALAVAGVAALVGGVDAPPEILRLPLPCFLGASLLFYLLTQDRRVSRWEGLLFVAGYLLLAAELAGLA